jgi:hypothetical protein
MRFVKLSADPSFFQQAGYRWLPQYSAGLLIALQKGFVLQYPDFFNLSYLIPHSSDELLFWRANSTIQA